MDIRQPPTEISPIKPEGDRRGLVIVNTGDGKGKSTAAFGLALRAHGRGKAVHIFQFMKVPSARFGEHRAFEQLGVPVEGLGDGFSWKSKDLEHSAQLARDGWARAAATIAAARSVPCSISGRPASPKTCSAVTRADQPRTRGWRRSPALGW
mgnify:CR=1 FL=1